MKKAATKAPARGAGKRIGLTDITEIREWHAKDKSIKWIAERMGISERAVGRWVHRDEDDLVQHFGSGRPATLNTAANQRVLQQVQRQHKHNTLTRQQFRAKVIVSRKRGSKAKAELRGMSDTTFRRTMQAAALSSKKTIKKPIGMVLKSKERLSEAKKRLRWTKEFANGIIYMDQSCGQRAGGTHCVVSEGQDRTIVTHPDGKDEKVHFLVGIGNGWKSPFEALNLRPAVLKDANGNTVRRTLATGRVKKGKTPAERSANAKRNTANQGETWTADKIISILRKRNWLPALKRATGVVLDAQHGFHKKVCEFLVEQGVNVIEHPPHSPDMNLVEFVHGSIKNSNTKGVQEAMNNHQLLAAYQQNWRDYRYSTFQRIVDGHKKTLQRIVDKNGGPTTH